MTAPEYGWTDEGAVGDADGALIGAYDDIELLVSAPIHSFGSNCDKSMRDVPAGTLATVLFLTVAPEEWVDVECILPNDGFAFTRVKAREVRLRVRARDKRRT